MRGHGERTVYHMIGGEAAIVDPLSPPAAGCPMSGTATAMLAAATAQPQPPFRFGRLFDANPCAESSPWGGLAELGRAMNAEMPDMSADKHDSTIPAGYTYLGQFIAHELTFDKTNGLQDMAALPDSERTPTLDLDSLYGYELTLTDEQRAKMYEGDALKRGQNMKARGYKLVDMTNDLPRELAAPYKAVIGDERNDENLPLAQTHLAFIKFHNRVVQYLVEHPDTPVPGESLLKRARRMVVRHFQKIVLDDYLPMIIDSDVLKAVLEGKVKRLIDEKVKSKDQLFMPVEFSAASFRLGHSMVRATYDYNYFQRRGTLFGDKFVAKLPDFFNHTQHSGNLDGLAGLASDWVIDWRRFYDFSNMPVQNPGGVVCNMAKKINTSFNLHLNKIDNYPHNLADEHKEYKAITIRNLIRGCCLKLPTGQSVARQLGEEPMEGTAITDGETDEVKAALHGFEHDTPLWFYILKEAKEKGNGGNRLGPVGSRIIAETFYAVIKYSAHSILDEHDRLTEAEMLPRRPHDKPDKFDMVDMLTFMGELNPTLYD